MIGFLWRRVLTTSAENRRLEKANTQLTVALHAANDTADQLRARVEQLHRDCDLLALMAQDRQVALEFLRTAHEIDAR